MVRWFRSMATWPWERQRWLIIGSALWILALALVVGIVSRGRWAWPIFFVAFGFGVLGAVAQHLLMAAYARLPEAIPERRAGAESRRRVFMVNWLIFGAALGSVAAGLDQWWIVVFGIVLMTASFGAGIRLGARALRRAREA